MRPITTLLVANRGEIARRILRTARARGLRTVAVFSDPDRDLPHVREADVAVRLGPAAASESYLHTEGLIDAARRTGADAVHPGYGFLSENAGFAQAVLDAGLVWVGPSPRAIAQMGDKATARRLAASHGVPVLPGYDGDQDDLDTLRVEAARIGVPLLVKAVAGGGGRGMRRVDDLASLEESVASARREAQSAFGDGRVLLERYVERPRHIEIQVFGDASGQVVHLAERECSIQRRHQKIVEEAPSPVVTPELREAMGQAAVALARAVDYVGAGTVEFILDEQGQFHFLEMNTRLQVEHPVTEEIHGLDLVDWQLSIAEGAPLPLDQASVDARRAGHAIEVRLYAEDPLRDGMPGTGILRAMSLGDGPGVRLDVGFEAGDEVGASYDPMLGKIIARGRDRLEACRRLRRALEASWVPGLPTNLPLLRQIVADEDFLSGDMDTSFLARRALPQPPPANLEEGAALVAACSAWCRARTAPDAQAPFGFRLWGPSEAVDRWAQGSDEVEVGVTHLGDALSVRVDEGTPQRIEVLREDGASLVVSVDGVVRTVRWVSDGALPPEDGDTVWIHLGHGESMVRLLPRFPAVGGEEEDPGSLHAPSPGVVRQIHVQEGDEVSRGQALVVLEAMKMEQTLTAPADGVVAAVRCEEGDAVEEGRLLVVLRVEEEPG